MINIVLCQDTCELISFKLGMALDRTKLYSVIPVWMTLMFTQGHRGKLELCSHSVVKLHETTQMFVMVDYVRGDNYEEVLYSEYGSFEHLFF